MVIIYRMVSENSCSSHWVTAYKGDSGSEVKVYDSLFDSVDDIVETVIMNIFEAPKIIK